MQAALEQRVLALLQGDATLTALCPSANMAIGEVWTLPGDALYPHISVASTIAGPSGPADDTAFNEYLLTFWCEDKNSRLNALGISDRIIVLFNRQQKAMSTVGPPALGVIMCRLLGAPMPIRDPRTEANLVAVQFRVIAS